MMPRLEQIRILVMRGKLSRGKTNTRLWPPSDASWGCRLRLPVTMMHSAARLAYLVVATASLTTTCAKPVVDGAARCTPEWVRGWGAQGDDRTESVGVDIAGNIYVSGWFQGTVDFGLGAVAARGDRDAYVMRRSGDGKATWLRHFGGSGKDVAWALAVSESGNVAIASVYHDDVALSEQVTLPRASGGYDVAVAQYSPSGDLLWHMTLNGPEDEHLFGITVNKHEEVIVTGSFGGSITVAGEETLASLGERDGLVVKIGAHGDVRWSRRFGGSGSDFGYGVTSDAQGRVIVGGSVQAMVDFGAGPTRGGNNNDAAVIAYDADGELLWARRFGDDKGQETMSVAMAPDGGIALGGQFTGVLDFGNERVEVRGDKPDAFIALLDPAGNIRWARAVGAEGASDAVRSVAVDGGGNVVATGSFQRRAEIDGQWLESSGLGDVFVAKFAPTGQRQWACGWGGSGNEIGYWITTDREDNVIIAGAFQETTLPMAEADLGENNGFLMKLAPCGCSSLAHGEPH